MQEIALPTENLIQLAAPLFLFFLQKLAAPCC